MSAPTLPPHLKDTEALNCYSRYLSRAVRQRDLSRENTGHRLRQSRRASMRFWARLAVPHCPGCRGPIKA